jgi:hypothetical protein
MRASAGCAAGANMSYGLIVRVQAPVQAYETAHGEVLKALDGQQVQGLLCHIGREIDGGFEVIGVWGSKEASVSFNEEVVIPAMVRAGFAIPEDPPEPIEFEPLDVMIGRR